MCVVAVNMNITRYDEVSGAVVQEQRITRFEASDVENSDAGVTAVKRPPDDPAANANTVTEVKTLVAAFAAYIGVSCVHTREMINEFALADPSSGTLNAGVLLTRKARSVIDESRCITAG